MRKRMISLLMCVVMLVSILPVKAIAMDTEPKEQVAETGFITEGATVTAGSMMEPLEKVAESAEVTSVSTEEITVSTEAMTEPIEETTVPTEAATEPTATLTIPSERSKTEGTEPAENPSAPFEKEMMPTPEQIELTPMMVAADSGTCGENLTWTLDSEGVLTVSGSGVLDTDSFRTDLRIKKVVLEEGITGIGDDTFYGCENLTTVILPNSLKSIGSYAFGLCINLQAITIPDTVVSIGNGAFKFCMNLTVISIPYSVIEIAEATFSDCKKLMNVSIPNSVTSIKPGAFDGCDSLITISIPASVTEIGFMAFAGCDNLLQITVADENMAYSSVDGVMFNKDKSTLIVCPGGKSGSYIIPQGVMTIEEEAFSDCKKLSSVSVPEGVTSIKDNAFWGCQKLTSIRFEGDAPSYIGRSFSGVTATAYYPANNTTWTNEVKLNYGGNLTWVSYGEEEFATSGTCGSDLTWSFEDGVLNISGTGWMDYWKTGDVVPWHHLRDQITSVVIGEGASDVGSMAFVDCKVLSDVEIPTTVQSIGYSAFYECSSLNGIEIPSNVIDIGYFDIGSYAFANCVSLSSIQFPASLVGIGVRAFEGDTSLTEFRFEGDAPIFACGIPDYIGRSFSGVTATAYYPANNTTWTNEVKLNYGGNLTWVPYGAVENQIMIPAVELDGQTSVWIDGKEYAVNTDGGVPSVDLPNGKAETMITYAYGESNGKPYPTGMKVWTLTNEDGIYTAQRVEELDDMLGYAGCSIRITGKQGIRMITSIDEVDKDALTGAGLAGYTLKEYGTAIAWADQLSSKKPLVLGKSYVRYNYAYSKENGKDPIYDNVDGRMQYTNVLVGFGLNQCNDDIAMRPYMILEDAEGSEITLYGGIVERSIGYIASEIQKKNLYAPDSAECEYLQKIIDAAMES